MSRIALFLAASVALGTLLPSRAAVALDYCYYYFGQTSGSQNCPDPNRSTVVGGSFPSFSDAFNINPASIPTVPTPYGLEYIGSSASPFGTTALSNFALIKGMQNFGTAISTNSDKTFYSQNIVQALQGDGFNPSAFNDIVNSARTQPSFNLGSALGLPLEAIKKFTIPTLGLGLKYDRITQKWEFQPGISINSEHFTLGYSWSNQAATQYLGASTLKDLSVGLKFADIQLEYTRLDLTYDSLTYYWTIPAITYGYSGPVPPEVTTSGPGATITTEILTGSIRVSSLVFQAAYRTFNTLAGNRARIFMGSANFRVTRFLALSYLYNYIPGNHSFGIQLML